ncbi:MAG TPA: hypothetical protein DCQ98_09455 [Planctomycetaceae bacterium]|nr:hypothetical protein [Planctomycetaceae bacterium]
MAKVTIVVTGDREINAMLARLDGPRAKSAIRQGARHALRPVLAAAKRHAPKDTGTLGKNIKLRALKRSRARIGARVTSGGKTSTGKSTDYTGDAYHGAFQEFGWTPGKRGGKRGTKVAGKHFMKRAADESEAEAMRRYREFLKQKVEELAR